MKHGWIESLYTKYKNYIILSNKNYHEWVSLIKDYFPVEKVEINDRIIKEFEFIKELKDDLDDNVIYLLKKDKNTKIYYDFNEQRFVGEQKIYIILDNKNSKIHTNCQLLQFKINIFRGISKDDIVNKTTDYKNYLNELYLYDWLKNSE